MYTLQSFGNIEIMNFHMQECIFHTFTYQPSHRTLFLIMVCNELLFVYHCEEQNIEIFCVHVMKKNERCDMICNFLLYHPTAMGCG